MADAEPWAAFVDQLFALAPPPSLVKCLGATLVGSLFALAGMAFEGFNESRRSQKAEQMASPAKPEAQAGQSGKAAAARVPASGGANAPTASNVANVAAEAATSAATEGTRAAAAPAAAGGADGAKAGTDGARVGAATGPSRSPGGASAPYRPPAARAQQQQGAQARTSSAANATVESSLPSRPAKASPKSPKQHAPSAPRESGGAQQQSRPRQGSAAAAPATAGGSGATNGASAKGGADARRRDGGKSDSVSSPKQSPKQSNGADKGRTSPTSLVRKSPLMAARVGASGELSEVAKASRQVKSILNKMTRESFDKLYAQLLASFPDSDAREEVIMIVAQEVFAKATMQHSFVEMYADVCSKLCEDLKSNNVQACFRRALLDQCQKSFNLYLDPPRINRELDYEEQYEELVKYKTRMLGNVRLIGHLLQRRMLSAKIVFHCSDELLTIASPEALETLSVFLGTIGGTFDTPHWQGHARLEGVFMRTEILARDATQPPRVRCLLKDVLELRQRGWKEKPQKALPEATPASRKVVERSDTRGSWRS
eukprot:TRINITY_DN25225_c0_g1_i1.p1 TRINITY_DN25225_c0_g1~~TRINITY_DN25225_c0_g1_i1.p1  ORF type:complete len:613 (+),score=120.64 TRINITY_DN25225_c0_g1_i1:208-1839(+)